MRKRLTALLLSFVMLLTMLPVTVSAEGAEETGGGTATGHVLDISYGDITITNNGFTYYVADDADATQVQEKTYNWVGGEKHKLTITGMSVGDTETPTPAHIVRIMDGDPEITLDNVMIEHPNVFFGDKNKGYSDEIKKCAYAPGIVLMSGTATLALKGSNAITGSNQGPAVQINKDAVLTIKDSGDGDGVLVAESRNHVAAIGAPRANKFALNGKGNPDNACISGGKLIVESGVIEAKNTTNAGQAGAIGASNGSYFGDITIKGGTVTATTDCAYGIATYTNRNVSENGDVDKMGSLNIEGGKVSAITKKDDLKNDAATIKANDFTMSAGTLVEMTAKLVHFNVQSATITGGNTNDYYDGTAEVNGIKVKLYFFDAESKPLTNADVTVDSWTAMTDSDGTITTYLPADTTSVTYNGKSYTLKNGAALLGLTYGEENALPWEAGDPLAINIDGDTTGAVCGKVDGSVNVNAGAATLKLVQSEGNTWTVTAKEAASGVTMDVSSVNGRVRFGNEGDYQYQMGYVTADKVKLNPDGGDVTVNQDGSVIWGKYTLTGIGEREIVVNGADKDTERTVTNSGSKAITVNGETLAAGGSLTVPKALYQQEYYTTGSKTESPVITGTAASYILPGTTELYEYAPTKDSVILRDRYSYWNEKEYRAVFGNAFKQVGTVDGYRLLVVGEGDTEGISNVKDDNGGDTIQNRIAECYIDSDIHTISRRNGSYPLYATNIRHFKVEYATSVTLYSVYFETIELGAQVVTFGSNNKWTNGYLNGLQKVIVDEGNTVFSVDDGVLYSDGGKILELFPRTKTGDYKILDTCEKIADAAFSGSQLSTLTLGKNVSELGGRWFEGAIFTAVNVPAANPYLRSENGVLYNADMTELLFYPRYKQDATFVIPDGVTTAADMAIYNNPYLTKVVIPASLAKVGSYFLGQCSKLEEVVVGNSLEKQHHLVTISSQVLKKATVPGGYVFHIPRAESEKTNYNGFLEYINTGWGVNSASMGWTSNLYITKDDGSEVYAAPTAVSVTYDGQPHGIEVTCEDTGVTIQYSLDGKTWSDSVQCIEPGEYTIYWKAVKAADDTYKFQREVNSSVTLTITGLPVEKTWFTLESVRKVGDANINTTEPVTFTLPEGNIAIDGNCVTYTYNDNIELPTAAGSYLVKVAVKGATGYADTEFELGYYTILDTDSSSEVVMSFVTNGGTAIEPIIAAAGTTITAPAVPTREGYTFEGWHSDVTLQTKVKTLPANMPNESITYYAKWTPVEYTITYNGVEGLSVSNPAAYTIETPDFTLTNPTKPGYAFKGWQVGDSESAVVQTVEIKKGTTGDMTFTAIFEQETYAITYVECAEGAKTYKMGDTVTLPVPADRKGYTFMGWTLNIDGRTMVQDKSETTLPTHLYGDMTVTGIWLANDQTLTFNANGGTFSAKFGGKETYAVTAKTDSKFKLPDAPTRPGYTFQGWFMEANGTTAFDAAVMPSADTTIYAKWAVDAQLTAPEGVTVDGLDKVAQAKAAEIRMSIEATGADGDAQRAISTKAGSRVQLSFYEMTVLADGSPLSDIGTVIAIKIPFQTAGRSITVYRYHGSEAQTLTKLDAVPAAPVDGTYFVGDGYVMIYSSQFSTYAIGYTETASSGGRRHYTGTPGAEITGGADQTKRAGDIIKVTAKSDGAKVSAVYVDGAMVDGKYYIVSGNAVKLQGTYTATLSQGTHTLRVVYTNGAAVTTTFVLKGTTSPQTGDPGVGIYLASVVLSIAGSAYVFRKKKSDD